MMRWTLALLCLWAANSLAQAPATTPDPSPLYVVTYVDLKPTAKSDGAMKIRRDTIKEMPAELKQIIEDNK